MIAEFLLFVSRFEAGRYGKFYGDTSYALTVTDALNKFLVERKSTYADIEREKHDKELEKSNIGTVTFWEYKRMKEDRGERVSDTLNNFYGKKD